MDWPGIRSRQKRIRAGGGGKGISVFFPHFSARVKRNVFFLGFPPLPPAGVRREFRQKSIMHIHVWDRCIWWWKDLIQLYFLTFKFRESRDLFRFFRVEALNLPDVETKVEKPSQVLIGWTEKEEEEERRRRGLFSTWAAALPRLLLLFLLLLLRGNPHPPVPFSFLVGKYCKSFAPGNEILQPSFECAPPQSAPLVFKARRGREKTLEQISVEIRGFQIAHQNLRRFVRLFDWRGKDSSSWIIVYMIITSLYRSMWMWKEPVCTENLSSLSTPWNFSLDLGWLLCARASWVMGHNFEFFLGGDWECNQTRLYFFRDRNTRKILFPGNTGNTGSPLW